MGGGPRGSGNQNARVYVGNLAWDVAWQDLKDHMRGLGGEVIRADVMTDQGGRSRGCGIVEYAEPAQATQAIEQLNNSELKNRMIFVREVSVAVFCFVLRKGESFACRVVCDNDDCVGGARWMARLVAVGLPRDVIFTPPRHNCSDILLCVCVFFCSGGHVMVLGRLEPLSTLAVNCRLCVSNPENRIGYKSACAPHELACSLRMLFWTIVLGPQRVDPPILYHLRAECFVRHSAENAAGS